MASTSGQALEVIVSPEALALRKNDAKRWLRVSGDADDALINMQCAAAVAWLESMGVYLITQTVAQHFRDLRWSESLKLWAGPIHSIAGVSVSHEGGAYEELAASEWRLDPALHELEPREYWDLSWFRTWSYADILRVEYQVGFGAAYDSIPQNLYHACLQYIGVLYEVRDGSAVVPESLRQAAEPYRSAWFGA